jgi:hypothetical protein
MLCPGAAQGAKRLGVDQSVGASGNDKQKRRENTEAQQ